MSLPSQYPSVLCLYSLSLIQSPESALSVKLLSTVLNGDFAAGVDLEALVQHMGLLSNIASNLAISIAGFADRLDMREKGLVGSVSE